MAESGIGREGRARAGSQDPAATALSSVKDVFLALSRAVSAFKLFPEHNEMVVRFRGELTSKLQACLALIGELEVEVRQGAFLYGGHPVWQDENVIHSLPYLFFKDGLKTLTFLPGITSEEIAEFLALVKNVALLPLESSDIVDALWQRDFVGIRYYASDEFLESKIPVDHKIPPAFHVRKEDLYRGRLELRAEDGEAALKVLRDRGAAGAGLPPRLEESPAPGADDYPDLDEEDLKRLETLLGEERRAYEEKDFMDLVFELLQVEERPEAFADILAYLEGHHILQIQSLDFASAVRLAKMMEPLSRQLEAAGPERLKAFAKLRAGLGAKAPWPDVRTAAAEGRIPDPDRLFEYLALRGPAMLPLAADIYEQAPRPELRKPASGYFERMARLDPAALAGQARSSGPEAAKAILAALAVTRDPRSIPALEEVLSGEEASVRLKAVQVLGAIPDPAAQRILARLLRDPDRAIRIEAARLARLEGDAETVRSLIGLVEEKAFSRRGEAETSALLLALARSGADEAFQALAGLLRRRAFFGRAGLRAVQIGAARALKAAPGEAAARILAEGSRRGSRGARQACREALAGSAPADLERGPL